MLTYGHSCIVFLSLRHTNQNTEVCALTRRTECAMGDAVFLQGQRGVNSTSSDACAQRMERRPRQGRPAPLVISQLKILATQPCAGHRAPMPIICAQAVHIEHLVVFSELQAPDPGRKEIVPPPQNRQERVGSSPPSMYSPRIRTHCLTIVVRSHRKQKGVQKRCCHVVSNSYTWKGGRWQS